MLPAVDQSCDMAPLRLRELHSAEQAPCLRRIVVRDGRLEPLAPGSRFPELPTQPAQQAHACLISHRARSLIEAEAITAPRALSAGRIAAMKEILAEVVRWRQEGERVVVATVVATRRSAPRPIGSSLAVSESGKLCGSVSGGCVESDVYEHAREVLASGEPKLISYGISDEEAWTVGLPCGGEIDVFVERLA